MSAYDRQEALRRMCQLQERVSQEVIGFRHAADCFCGEGGYHPLDDPEDYRNDFKAIEWIEETVEAAIAAQQCKISR